MAGCRPPGSFSDLDRYSLVSVESASGTEDNAIHDSRDLDQPLDQREFFRKVMVVIRVHRWINHPGQDRVAPNPRTRFSLPWRGFEPGSWICEERPRKEFGLVPGHEPRSTLEAQWFELECSPEPGVGE
jgi:hypothetical protein